MLIVIELLPVNKCRRLDYGKHLHCLRLKNVQQTGRHIVAVYTDGNTYNSCRFLSILLKRTYQSILRSHYPERHYDRFSNSNSNFITPQGCKNIGNAILVMVMHTKRVSLCDCKLGRFRIQVFGDWGLLSNRKNSDMERSNRYANF